MERTTAPAMDLLHARLDISTRLGIEFLQLLEMQNLNVDDKRCNKITEELRMIRPGRNFHLVVKTVEEAALAVRIVRPELILGSDKETSEAAWNDLKASLGIPAQFSKSDIVGRLAGRTGVTVVLTSFKPDKSFRGFPQDGVLISIE